MTRGGAGIGGVGAEEPFRFSRNNLDLIRLVAAADVAIKHGMVHLGVGEQWAEWLGFFPGVPVFFFVSGFLIYRSYLNAPSLAVFAANRFLRLFPGLVVCLLFSIGLVLVTGYLPPSRLLSSDFLVWAAAQLSIGQFYNWEALRAFGVGVINGSLWTISVELQFYILTPIIALLLGPFRRGLAVASAVFLLGNIAFLFMDPDTVAGKLSMVSFVPWIYMFLVGAFISTNEALLKRIIGAPWWLLLATYGLALGISILADFPYLGNYSSPLVFLPICGLVVKAAYTRPSLSERILRRNDVSYGLYIYHMPIINALLFYGIVGHGSSLALAMVLTAAAASASWLLVERPALARKKASLRGPVPHP